MSGTIQSSVAEARQRLVDAGIHADEAALDARVLAQRVLGWDPERYFRDGREAFPADRAEAFEAAIARRVRREPMAYVLGYQEFWSMDFEVTPAVLIPRAETELIVESVQELIPDLNAKLRVADVCTGSGCLAVAIASEYPRARVVASDVSAEALDIARRNARWQEVADHVSFVQADLLDGIDTLFDIIVANPPYVREGDRRGLQPEVRDYEPAVALYAGPSGLTLTERLVHQVPARLAPHGFFLFEFGLGQDDEIEGIVGSVPELRLVEMKRDFQGICRTAIVARRP